MTRTAEVTSTFRLLAGAAVIAVALPLSGCLLPPPPADPAPVEEPADSPEPSDEPAEAGGDLPDGLSFDQGQELTETAYIEWGDGLMTDDGWTVVAPDNGDGGWTYGTADGACTARFWQGYIADVPVTAGDDSASSDAMLAALLQSDAATITPAATTGEFNYQISGSGGVENRQVLGVEGERSWIMSARAFTRTGVGVYLIVDCTGGDANAVLAEVIDKNAIVVSP
ncbi:hypothetical protein [Microbacterium aurantiacum]|uniref:hypothetical protein n=1 Tax=Microbacterium aurantiacum TaxID=162393 RepID=UPI0011AF5E33|nr:hypothetical protein [Microbacterium aurantiacum]